MREREMKSWIKWIGSIVCICIIIYGAFLLFYMFSVSRGTVRDESTELGSCEETVKQESSTGRDENYDFREDMLQMSADFEDVQRLQEGMQDALALSKEVQIDFTKAVRVLSYTSNEFLECIDNDNVMSELQKKEKYCWKMPIEDNGQEGGSYVVAYQVDGEWSYYTAHGNLELWKEQVSYIFDSQEIETILIENGISDLKSAYAVTISEVNVDLIVADDGLEVYAIPYASRSDFLNWENRGVYSFEEIYDKIITYVEENQEAQRKADYDFLNIIF